MAGAPGQGYCPAVVETMVSSLPAPGAALGRCAVAREVKHPMTSQLSGPLLPALSTRGSTHVGASGLLVLGLGSLVLLTGLAPPAPAANDVVAFAIPSGAGGLSLAQGLAGAAMIGTTLVLMGLRRRVHAVCVMLAAGI